MAVDAAAPRERASTPRPIALWVVPVSALGGVARHVIDAARVGLPGFSLVVLTPPGPLADELQRLGVRIAVGRFGPEAGVMASIRTLKATAHRLQPNVVHSHLSYADVIVAATPLPRHTIRVTTEHGIAGDDRVYHGSALKSKLMATVHSARLRRFDAVIAVSQATKLAMLEKWSPRQQVRVILNGVDPFARGEVRRPDPDHLRVLALARLSPEKRLPQLLRAFERVLKVRPDARLTIAGIGEVESELRVLAAQLGIGESVSFPGFVDPDLAMAEADVLAQLSVWENCSYSLLDAANRGMRVVASDVGGNPEIVSSRGLVDADDIEGVAEALLDAGAVTHLDGWLSVRDMTTAVAEVYADAGAARFVTPKIGKVSLATNNGDVGGGEVMLLNLAGILTEIGLEVDVVGPSKPGGLVAAARTRGLHVVELQANGRLEWMRALRDWDKRSREGLLWCNGIVPGAATAGHSNRILHLHQLPRGRSQRLLAGFARLGTLATLVPSEWMRSQIPGSLTLKNWTEPLEFRAPGATDSGITILGFLGRPSASKGVTVLVSALKILESSHPGEFRLRIGGEPFFVSEEEKQVVETALNDVADLTTREGWVDKADFLQNIDLLVVPSVWPETFGLVAAEAMSAGVPVIVSDAGALSTVVADSRDVFPVSDSEALALAILRKRDEGLSARVDENYARWEANFSPHSAQQSVRGILSQVVMGLRSSE